MICVMFHRILVHYILQDIFSFNLDTNDSVESYISIVGAYRKIVIRDFDFSQILFWERLDQMSCSTSPSGGNQVDGLPPG